MIGSIDKPIPDTSVVQLQAKSLNGRMLRPTSGPNINVLVECHPTLIPTSACNDRPKRKRERRPPKVAGPAPSSCAGPPCGRNKGPKSDSPPAPPRDASTQAPPPRLGSPAPPAPRTSCHATVR